MSSAAKLLLTIVAVIGIGLGIGWWATRDSGVPPVQPVTTNNGGPQPPVTGQDQPLAFSKSPGTAARPQAASSDNAVSPAIVSPVQTAAGNVLTNWEDKIDEILGGDADESEKANRMLQIFPNLPEDGQIEVAQHLSNLLPDQQYPALGGFLTNTTLSEPVLDVLVADLLNRPNGVKLPMLLDIARTDQHPKATEAHEILELFLEEDFGKDWNKWQTKMQQWLQENPD